MLFDLITKRPDFDEKKLPISPPPTTKQTAPIMINLKFIHRFPSTSVNLYKPLQVHGTEAQQIRLLINLRKAKNMRHAYMLMPIVTCEFVRPA